MTPRNEVGERGFGRVLTQLLMTAYSTMDLIDLEIRLVDSIHGLDCHRDRGFRLITTPVTIPPGVNGRDYDAPLGCRSPRRDHGAVDPI